MFSWVRPFCAPQSIPFNSSSNSPLTDGNSKEVISFVRVSIWRSRCSPAEKSLYARRNSMAASFMEEDDP